MSVLKHLTVLGYRELRKKVALLIAAALCTLAASMTLAQTPPASTPADWGPVSMNREEMPEP